VVGGSLVGVCSGGLEVVLDEVTTGGGENELEGVPGSEDGATDDGPVSTLLGAAEALVMLGSPGLLTETGGLLGDTLGSPGTLGPALLDDGDPRGGIDETGEGAKEVGSVVLLDMRRGTM